ncbi:MAG: quinate 5-dehydrogenase [bacterium JZ-2024 1]
MKRVISVSLGSSRRDAQVELSLGKEVILVERVGMDGDLKKAKAFIEAWDGKADAFGLGGIDLYLYLGKRKYLIRDAKKLADAAKITPVVDGSGLKHTVERNLVANLSRRLSLVPEKTRVLVVSAVDRYGMAETFFRLGFQVVFGDLIFALGIPYPIRTLRGLHLLGSFLLPLVVRLPFHFLYPVGKEQEKRSPKKSHWFEEADIIAGDFHFIRKYAPEELKGKIIVTNTTTPEDVEDFRRRGISWLITTTPVLGGRTFGTNVLEACLYAYKGMKKGESLPEEEYQRFCEEFGLSPEFRNFEKKERER